MRLVLFLVLFTSLAAGECVSFEQAPDHIGEELCIVGKVLTVTESPTGAVWFLNFCEDWAVCPFSAVVFAKDLRHVGDIRVLEGKRVEIFGKVKPYKGRPEIIIREARQLKGEAAKLPPLPKEFDVQRQGRFSAGRIRPAPKSKTAPAEKTDVENKD